MYATDPPRQRTGHTLVPDINECCLRDSTRPNSIVQDISDRNQCTRKAAETGVGIVPAAMAVPQQLMQRTAPVGAVLVRSCSGRAFTTHTALTAIRPYGV